MDKNKFDALLPMITADVVDKITNKFNIDEDSALYSFMRSKVYELLEIEETKLWYYSSEMLLELYSNELNGNLILPEV